MSDLKGTLQKKVNQTKMTRQQSVMEQGQEAETAVFQGEDVENESKAGMEMAMEKGTNAVAVVPDIAVGVEQAKNRIKELQEFIKYMMVPSIDYGFIPGCPKPMLFKSGAEKLCDIYGLTKRIEVTKRVEDWDKGIFHYEVKATLTNKRTSQVESEGVGCCNNREKKFASQDPFSIVNSILKMAKKRAIVDATLTATRTSGIFGQDLDNHAA